MEPHHPTLIGALTGFLFGLVAVPFKDIESTIILSIIGAATGFWTSMFMKWVWKKLTNKTKKK